MSTLEQAGKFTSDKLTDFMQRPLRWGIRRILTPVMAVGNHVIEYRHLNKSLNELGNLVDETTLLAIIISHNSHADILPGIELTKAVRSRFPKIGDFYFPVAASLVRGVQGFHAQLLYEEGALPHLQKPALTPLSTVTENDMRNRHLTQSFYEGKQIIKAAKEKDSALLVFAEGTVESGRYDVLGNIRGIQQVNNEFLPFVFQKAKEIGRKVVILPVGITGTNKILSAESIFMTWRGVGALIQDWGFKKPPTLARVIIGHPYELNIEAGQMQEINDRVMSSIAELKPIEERGYYDPQMREYQTSIKNFEEEYKKRRFGTLRLRLLKLGLLPHPKELRQLAQEFPSV